MAKALSRQDVDKIIKDKLAWILSACAPERIILFGSAAEYEMTEASDVDLIVIFKDKTALEQSKEKLYLSRPPDDWPHDLLLHTVESFQKSVAKGGGVCWLAENNGRVLFERQSL